MWTTSISLASDIKEEKLQFSLCWPSSLTFKWRQWARFPLLILCELEANVVPFFPSALFIRGCGSSNGRRQPHWDSPSVTEEHAETASGHLSSPQRTAAWRRRWSFGYFPWMCQPLVSRWLTDWLIFFFTVFRRRGRENMCNRWAGEGCSPYDGLSTPPSAFPIRSVST